MANEVSSYFLRTILEAGELFGVKRETLLDRLPDPAVADERWGSLDWSDFLPVFRAAVAPAGSGEDLIAAGRRYMRERHGTRTAHLYGQFLSWDKVLWVASHFMAPRLVKGYTFEYEKLGTDHFRISMAIPERLEGDRDFFFYLTGLWTGSSRTANLRHEVRELEVGSHSAVAEVLLGKRSSKSKLLHNPVVSLLMTLRDLRESRRDLRERAKALKRNNDDLLRVLEATTDVVWVGKDTEVTWENPGARQLRRSDPRLFEDLLQWAGGRPDDTASDVWTSGSRFFRLRDRRVLTAGRGTLYTVAEDTAKVTAAGNVQNAPLDVRREAFARFSQKLGSQLKRLDEELASAQSNLQNHAELAGDFAEMRKFTALCQRHGTLMIRGEEEAVANLKDFHRAIRDLADDFHGIFGFPVSVSGTEIPVPESPNHLRDLFLICQEAVRNAWRHARANRVHICFTGAGMEIIDDGSGLSEKTDRGGGIGIASIQSRASALGLDARTAEMPRNGWVFAKRRPG